MSFRRAPEPCLLSLNNGITDAVTFGMINFSFSWGNGGSKNVVCRLCRVKSVEGCEASPAFCGEVFILRISKDCDSNKHYGAFPNPVAFTVHITRRSNRSQIQSTSQQSIQNKSHYLKIIFPAIKDGCFGWLCLLPSFEF